MVALKKPWKASNGVTSLCIGIERFILDRVPHMKFIYDQGFEMKVYEDVTI
ncbi:MAG: hypothetical protein RSB66_07065 [Clostridium sp.]